MADQVAMLLRLLRRQSRREQKETEEDKDPIPEQPRNEDIHAQIRSKTASGPQGQSTNASATLRQRTFDSSRSACHSPLYTTNLSQRFVPNWLRTQNHYHARVFCGQFSSDGSVFMTASQDQHVRLYHTNKRGAAEWKPFKQIHCRDVGWSVLDIDYSPDDRFLVYSTWSNYVQLCNVFGEHELHEGLQFSSTGGRFALFSVKFSADNREILGGASDAGVYLYDVERRARVLKIQGHSDDINTVCFADDSSRVFLSGSDDNLIKIWDRRVMADQGTTPSGVFTGHIGGITHLDAKGDGVYFISNSKDQTLKLWDIRKMKKASDVENLPQQESFDYRFGYVPEAPRRQSEHDCSVNTFRGHKVLETLIRCYFSPKFTTGQRFIYSGSQCGRIHIYDILTGNCQTLLGHDYTVRDVSWHPYSPLLLSSSWDATVGKWEHYRETPSDLTSSFRDLEYKQEFSPAYRASLNQPIPTDTSLSSLSSSASAIPLPTPAPAAQRSESQGTSSAGVSRRRKSSGTEIDEKEQKKVAGPRPPPPTVHMHHQDSRGRSHIEEDEEEAEDTQEDEEAEEEENEEGTEDAEAQDDGTREQEQDEEDWTQ